MSQFPELDKNGKHVFHHNAFIKLIQTFGLCSEMMLLISPRGAGSPGNGGVCDKGADPGLVNSALTIRQLGTGTRPLSGRGGGGEE